jgi:tetratricopeptide (TPR) repeat protein
MIGMNVQPEDVSLVEKGRELLERGDVPSAIECYRKIFDPDSVDEVEARAMLIEARSHLSRKHLLEALEAFEEALTMGTEVQRRQALEGITAIGNIRSRLGGLTADLKKGLKHYFGKKNSGTKALALVSDDENLVLIAEDAISRLPEHLPRSGRIHRIPERLTEYSLPIETEMCIPDTEPEDIRYILEVAAFLAAEEQAIQPQAS